MKILRLLLIILSILAYVVQSMDSVMVTGNPSYFQKNGFLLVRQLIDTNELDIYANILHHQQYNLHVGFESDDGSTKDFLMMESFGKQVPEVQPLVESDKLLAMATVLLNTTRDNLCIAIDKVFSKESGDRNTHWHTDSEANSIPDAIQALSAWMPMQETSPSNGGLKFVPESHRFDNQPSSSLKHNDMYSDPTNLDIYPQENMDFGDVSFHHIRTLHSAFSNDAITRRTAYSIMFLDVAPIAGTKYCSTNWGCPFGLVEALAPRAKDVCDKCSNVFAYQPPDVEDLDYNIDSKSSSVNFKYQLKKCAYTMASFCSKEVGRLDSLGFTHSTGTTNKNVSLLVHALRECLHYDAVDKYGAPSPLLAHANLNFEARHSLFDGDINDSEIHFSELSLLDYDENHDGHIDISEFSTFPQFVGPIGNELTKVDLKNLFRIGDVNGDQKMSARELASMPEEFEL